MLRWPQTDPVLKHALTRIHDAAGNVIDSALPASKDNREGVWNGSERTSFARKLKGMALWSALSSAHREYEKNAIAEDEHSAQGYGLASSGDYSSSGSRKQRGGPRISRRMIASR